MPTAYRHGILRGMFARCFYLSSSRFARRLSLSEALGVIIMRAGYPRTFVVRIARKWAASWRPQGLVFDATTLCDDVEFAIRSID